jgi:hypothetical protein
LVACVEAASRVVLRIWVRWVCVMGADVGVEQNAQLCDLGQSYELMARRVDARCFGSKTAQVLHTTGCFEGQ